MPPVLPYTIREGAPDSLTRLSLRGIQFVFKLFRHSRYVVGHHSKQNELFFQGQPIVCTQSANDSFNVFNVCVWHLVSPRSSLNLTRTKPSSRRMVSNTVYALNAPILSEALQLLPGICVTSIAGPDRRQSNPHSHGFPSFIAS